MRVYAGAIAIALTACGLVLPRAALADDYAKVVKLALSDLANGVGNVSGQHVTGPSVHFDSVDIPVTAMSGAFRLTGVSFTFSADNKVSGTADVTSSLATNRSTVTPALLGTIAFEGRYDPARERIVEGRLTIADSRAVRADTNISTGNIALAFTLIPAGNGLRRERKADVDNLAIVSANGVGLRSNHVHLDQAVTLAADGSDGKDNRDTLTMTGLDLSTAGQVRLNAGSISFSGNGADGASTTLQVSLKEFSLHTSTSHGNYFESGTATLALQDFKPQLITTMLSGSANTESLASLASALKLDLRLVAVKQEVKGALHYLLALDSIGTQTINGRYVLEAHGDSRRGPQVALDIGFEKLPPQALGMAIPGSPERMQAAAQQFLPAMFNAGTVLHLNSIRIDGADYATAISGTVTAAPNAPAGILGNATMRFKTTGQALKAQTAQMPRNLAEVGADGALIYKLDFQPSRILVNGHDAAAPPKNGTP